MRIPFIRKRLVVGSDRVEFIRETRGGSAFVLAGAVFWLAAAAASTVLPLGSAVNVYIFGGFSVPILGFVFARLQHARMFANPQYATLAAVASCITPFCIPVLLLVAKDEPQAVPAALTVIDGAHLLIFMWLHLEYSYFLASASKFALGSLFIWTVHVNPFLLVGLGSAAISAVTAAAAWSSSRDPLGGYRRAGLDVRETPPVLDRT